jgi:hypothetical protein
MTLVAGLGVGAWFMVRQPAMARHSQASAAAAPQPPADIDAPRMAAAIGLARMPDDPWTLAEAAAVAMPAASTPKDWCGMGQLPAYADAASVPPAATPLEMTRPGGAGYVEESARIDAALRGSADPFARAVADWLNIADTRTPGDRIDALVQAATTTVDPRVYALAYRACLGGPPGQGSCDLLNARQWAQLDAGNAVPWMYLFKQATDEGDVSGQQEALSHIASASRFDDRPQAAAATIAAQTPDDSNNLATAFALSSRAIGLSIGHVAPVADLFQACRAKAGGDANLAQVCAAVSSSMFDHSDSLRLHMAAGALYLQSTGDPALRDRAHAEMATLRTHWAPATGFSECGMTRDVLKQLRRSATLGEVEAMRERIHTAVTP